MIIEFENVETNPHIFITIKKYVNVIKIDRKNTSGSKHDWILYFLKLSKDDSALFVRIIL